MTVQYTLTKDDLREFAAYSRKHLPMTRGQVRTLGLIFVYCAYRAFTRAFTDEIGWLFPAVFFVFEFAILGLVVLGLEDFGRNRFVKPEHHTLTLTDDALTEVTPVNEDKRFWSGIHSVIDAPRHIYIFIDSRQARIIPKRAFADHDAERTFYSTATQLFSHARTSAYALP